MCTVLKGKKVQLSLCCNWAPRHEVVLGDWVYSSTHSLTSALDGGEWLASRPGHFTPRERASGTHWIGGWVGPRAVLEAVVKRKIPSPRRESNPRTPIVQPVALRYTDWAITAPTVGCSINVHSWVKAGLRSSVIEFRVIYIEKLFKEGPVRYWAFRHATS
jgi:hypothetical protein